MICYKMYFNDRIMAKFYAMLNFILYNHYYYLKEMKFQKSFFEFE